MAHGAALARPLRRKLDGARARRVAMTQLIGSGDGGGLEHCASCGALAAGPCARCRKPLCGDCCVITRHGVSPWAICFRCARGGGSSLRGAWFGLLGWLGLLLVGLAALVLLLYALSGK